MYKKHLGKMKDNWKTKTSDDYDDDQDDDHDDDNADEDSNDDDDNDYDGVLKDHSLLVWIFFEALTCSCECCLFSLSLSCTNLVFA
jgi:hypothetical protein